jgi:addiction module RelE/StbE family toxin
MYKDLYHPAVKKDLKKLDKSVRNDVKKTWIPKLLSKPFAGEELTGPLAGIRSYHFSVGRVQYRIAYSINENEHIMKILMIAKREGFYQIIKRRLK